MKKHSEMDMNPKMQRKMGNDGNITIHRMIAVVGKKPKTKMPSKMNPNHFLKKMLSLRS